MKYCTQCGKQLEDGEICDCPGSQKARQEAQSRNSQENNFNQNFAQNQSQNQNFAQNQAQNFGQNQNQNFGQNQNNYNQPGYNNYSDGRFNANDFAQKGKDIFDGVSKNVGSTYQKIMDEREKAQARERAYMGSPDDLIIPHSMTSNDGEIPVKQFNLTTLRNLVFGFIPTGKAVGKLLITNKRVIFSAKGFDFNGSTNYQQEFSISEIGGVKFRKSYSFKFLRFLFIFIITSIAVGLFGSILFRIFSGEAGSKLLSLLSIVSVAVTGFILFFPGINNWIKLLVATISMGLSSEIIGMIGLPLIDSFYYGYGYGYSEGNLAIILALIKIIFLFIAIISVSKLADMEIFVATKGGGEAVMVKAKKSISILGVNDSNCGYTYVLPARDTEIALREVGAIIDDIQVLGDYGVEKWKQV